jgi:hypothetical protein
MNIIHRVIIPGPNQVSTTEYMQYKQHTQRIQNIIIKSFL